MIELLWLNDDILNTTKIVEPQTFKHYQNSSTVGFLENTMIVEPGSFGDNHDGSTLAFWFGHYPDNVTMNSCTQP